MSSRISEAAAAAGRVSADVTPQAPLPVVVAGAGAVEEAVARQACAFESAQPVRPADVLRTSPLDRNATALLFTSPRLSEAAPQILNFVERGFHVASACEQLTYPWLHPEAADLIDRVAKQHERAVVGCGLHAGVAVTVVPGMLAALARAPWCISISVRADARRMEELGQTLGIGRPAVDWDGRETGRDGLVEATHLCALTAGWEPVDAEFQREAIVDAGTVVGVRECVDIECRGEQWVSMELVLEVDATDEGRIKVSASPPVTATVTGILEGYEATAARLAELARALPELRPGLRLPVELPAWREQQS